METKLILIPVEFRKYRHPPPGSNGPSDRSRPFGLRNPKVTGPLLSEFYGMESFALSLAFIMRFTATREMAYYCLVPYNLANTIQKK